MTINVKMFHVFMKYEIFGDMDGSPIVTPEGDWQLNKKMKIREKKGNPLELGHNSSKSKSSIFELGKRPRDVAAFWFSRKSKNYPKKCKNQ